MTCDATLRLVGGELVCTAAEPHDRHEAKTEGLIATWDDDLKDVDVKVRGFTDQKAAA